MPTLQFLPLRTTLPTCCFPELGEIVKSQVLYKSIQAANPPCFTYTRESKKTQIVHPHIAGCDPHGQEIPEKTLVMASRVLTWSLGLGLPTRSGFRTSFLAKEQKVGTETPMMKGIVKTETR